MGYMTLKKEMIHKFPQGHYLIVFIEHSELNSMCFHKNKSENKLVKRREVLHPQHFHNKS